MPKRKPKPEKPVPVDPNAPVFSVGDRVEVIRPNLLWLGHCGEVKSVDGGLYRVFLDEDEVGIWLSPFHANIPAAELRKINV